jgi:hypothetical protein
MSKTYKDLCAKYEAEVYKRGDILLKYVDELYNKRHSNPDMDVSEDMTALYNEMWDYVTKYAEEYEKVFPGESFEKSFMYRKVLDDKYLPISDMMP